MAKKPTIERAADLLLRAQLAALHGKRGFLALEDVRREWNRDVDQADEVSKAAVRRAVRHLVNVTGQDGFEGLGSLARPPAWKAPGEVGRPRKPHLIWEWGPQLSGRVKTRARVRGLVNAFVASVAWAPFESTARGVHRRFFDVLMPLRQDEKDELARLRERNLYYQPAVRRGWAVEAGADDDDGGEAAAELIEECILAVRHSRPLTIGEYRTPNQPGVRAKRFEPWTFVQCYDGLYLLGRDLSDTDAEPPTLVALHRMKGVKRHRTATFVIPKNFTPGRYLGHGFGPFVGREGATLLFVPDREWPFVEEMEIPSEVPGSRRRVHGGREIRLGTGFNHGLRLWCRWQGIRIVESDGMPDWVRELQA